ncbi:MAG: hypothetical protein ACYDDF_03365 [Thermoplasmatota archaeon]
MEDQGGTRGFARSSYPFSPDVSTHQRIRIYNAKHQHDGDHGPRAQDEDKRFLDELQAKILLRTGRRISLDELLHRLVELAEEHEDEIILEDQSPRLTEAEIRAFLKPVDFGVETSEEDIDRILYGGNDAA